MELSGICKPLLVIKDDVDKIKQLQKEGSLVVEGEGKVAVVTRIRGPTHAKMDHHLFVDNAIYCLKSFRTFMFEHMQIDASTLDKLYEYRTWIPITPLCMGLHLFIFQ